MGWISVLIFVPVYVLGLFALAWWSDRHPAMESPRLRGAICGLSIAVFTGSWTYFSSIGAAARGGWGFLTTYMGATLAVTLFFPIMRRVADIVKRENIVSVADFLSARYGKSKSVGTLVAVLALTSGIPFLAQQLKALAMAWSEIAGTENSSFVMLVFTVVLASFVILFGARRATLTEHDRGLVRVVAAESAVKLLILGLFCVLCVVAILSLYPGKAWASHLGQLGTPPRPNAGWITGSLVAFGTMLCAPRQFYISFVQLERAADLTKGRWVLAGYLAISYILIIPVAICGMMLYGVHGTDMYIMRLSQHFGGSVLAVLAFIGAFSCVAAPLMVETAALSSMISNELVLPVLARTRWYLNAETNMGRSIVQIRRITICCILLMGWAYSSSLRPETTLGALGIVNSIGVLQFLPVFLLGLFWRRGNAPGAVAGLCGGFAAWLYLVAVPQFLRNLGIETGPGWSTQNVVLSTLSINTILYLAVSLLTKPSLINRMQAAAFIDGHNIVQGISGDEKLRGSVGDLKSLLANFLGERLAARTFVELEKANRTPLRDRDSITMPIARKAERVLAGAVGASLARQMMAWHLTEARWDAADMFRVLDDAAEAVQFNRELLQTTLDHISQGVYVVDRNGQMVAWNARYMELFNFPTGFIHIGQSIREVLRFSLSNTGQKPEQIEAYINLRLAQIRHGVPHEFERVDTAGVTLKISGSPMPAGRYVTTYSDVTELRQSAKALQLVNEQLEDRVGERTRELTAANVALADAKVQAERATRSQTRFLAAASHDLLQPLQAARLFIGTILEDKEDGSSASRELLRHADLSIDSADRLLGALLNLSRLEVGGIKPEVKPVAVKELFRGLAREFERVAAERGLRLRMVPSGLWVLSDSDLLRSVLQNLIGNAIRYTQSGSVLVGCRKDKDGIRFEVRDSGPGIPENSLRSIFQEFIRLPQGAAAGPGSGLGLSIAERVCKLLGHRLSVRSRLGEGSTFSVTVPVTMAPADLGVVSTAGRIPVGLKILCVENEIAVLRSMEGLLSKFGAQVSTASSMGQAVRLKGSWDIILADYHLEQDGNGIDLIEAMNGRARVFALLTANPSEDVTERAAVLNIEVIKKPVSPVFLRTFLARSDHLAVS